MPHDISLCQAPPESEFIEWFFQLMYYVGCGGLWLLHHLLELL